MTHHLTRSALKYSGRVPCSSAWKRAIVVVFLLAGMTDVSSADTALGITCDETSNIGISDHPALEPEIRKAVGQVLAPFRLGPNFEVAFVDDPRLGRGAWAAMLNPTSGSIGDRYVLIDPQWAAELLATNRQALLGILAHEVAHHLEGHTLSCGGSRHATELEADERAGFVMAQLGFEAETAESYLWLPEVTENATDTHPSRPNRLVSFRSGWQRGARESGRFREIIDVEVLARAELEGTHATFIDSCLKRNRAQISQDMQPELKRETREILYEREGFNRATYEGLYEIENRFARRIEIDEVEPRFLWQGTRLCKVEIEWATMRIPITILAADRDQWHRSFEFWLRGKVRLEEFRVTASRFELIR